MKVEHRELLERLRPARRVLVVDDHPSFRRCARALLQSEGFEVVGEAADGAAALAAVADLAP
jgi:DNA-binding NarL/FixJ family response regulator